MGKVRLLLEGSGVAVATRRWAVTRVRLRVKWTQKPCQNI